MAGPGSGSRGQLSRMGEEALEDWLDDHASKVGTALAKVKLRRALSGLELFGEALAGVLISQALVESVRLDQTLVAGHFDQSATGRAEPILGRLDQRASNALAAKVGGNFEDRDPADRPWAMDREHDMQAA